MINQQIIIPLHIKDEKIGYLTIISLLSKFNGSNFDNINESFSNVKKSEEPDSITPIQWCDLGNGPKILLLEETQYQITFKPLQSYDNINMIPTIQEKPNAVYQPFNQVGGLLNFGSYAGKSSFDVEIDGNRSDLVHFEVRFKKINYQKHYTQMIIDLAKAVSGILFIQNAPIISKI